MSRTNEDVLEGIGLESFQVSREMLFLLGCMVSAFAVRFLLIPENSVINGDGVYYTILGERFVSGDFGGGISAYWSPLYSVLTGISSLFFSDREFAGRFVSLVAGALLILPGYALIETFFGRTVAYIGTVLLVFHPFLIKSSGWVMTESLYTLVFTTCLLIGWNALTKGEPLKFLVTGLLLGAAYLIKPEAIGFVVLMLVFTLAAGLLSSGISIRRSGINCSTLLFGFLLVFTPYFIFLHEKTGQWTLSQKIAVNLPAADYEGEFLGLTSDGGITMKDRIWGDDYQTEYRTGTAAVPREPFSFARLRSDAAILGTKAATLVKKQIRDYFPAILPLPFLILAIAGLFTRPWTRARAAKEAYLFSFAACTLAGYAASTVELRYLFPIIPILIAWAANGIAEFSYWFVSTANEIFGAVRRISPTFVTVCVLILSLGSLTPLFLSIFKPDDIRNVAFEERDAGSWIKNNSELKKPLIMSSNITAAFYAEARHLYLPAEDLPTIVEYARRRQADYLLFSERRMGDAPAFLDEKNAALKGLRLVYHDDRHADNEILVYRVSN